ncbi:MAG: hypothetical protein HZB56_00410 [Deltaproteobacteria bacterium]|nr:hypothetical protein [Deltaproteobacteria bacterium]
MRTFGVLLLAALASCSAWSKLRPPAASDLLRIEGHVDRGPFGLSAADLAKLERRTLRGVDPRGGREAAYAGASLPPFFNEGLPLLRGADTAFFHGRGGYVAAVPLNAIRQSQPVLADQMDGKPLAEASPESGPLLLAWPDAEAPGLGTDSRQRWYWVRGVERIELGPWQETVGRATRVPLGASGEARLGADVFARQCFQCHRLRGRGGVVGPELTRLGVEKPDLDVVALLASHLAPRSGIPGAPELAPAAAQQVAAFLKVVARAGADRPEDEVRPPAPRQPSPGYPVPPPASRP